MEKRVLMLLFICGLAANMVFSQSSTGKQINEIKRDGQYFYAESTLETEEMARETATLMLANFINDYINSNNLPHDKKVTEQDLAKAQSLSMKRETRIRVFLYVKKSDFAPVGTVNEMSTKEEPEVQAPIAKEEPVAKDEPIEEVVQQKLETKTTDTSEQAIPAEDQPDTEPADQPVETADSNSMRLSVPWQQTAIEDILKKTSLTEVVALLNRLKAEYKVKRMGTYNESKNAALSFWVICENDSNSSLITVLGPGTDSRVNFKTMQHDSLGNYSGKNAMWFDFAK